jgi:hypothetical protein
MAFDGAAGNVIFFGGSTTSRVEPGSSTVGSIILAALQAHAPALGGGSGRSATMIGKNLARRLERLE